MPQKYTFKREIKKVIKQKYLANRNVVYLVLVFNKRQDKWYPKIGYTNHFKRRLTQLNRIYGLNKKIKILGFAVTKRSETTDHKKLEKKLHRNNKLLKFHKSVKFENIIPREIYKNKEKVVKIFFKSATKFGISKRRQIKIGHNIDKYVK